MRKSVVLLLVFFSLMGLCAVEVKSVSAVAEDSWMSLISMPTAPILTVIVVSTVVVAAGAGLLVYFRKRRRQS